MRKSKYSDEIINYIKKSPKGHIELENELGISRNTIRGIRRRFGIKIKQENKLNDKDIENLIIDFKNGFTIQKLVIKYNKDKNWIAKLLNDRGLETNRRLSNEQINIILKYFNKELASDVAKRAGCSESSVFAVYKRFNKENYKKVYEHLKYFDNIDSDDKAYFLGFIAADGCVYTKDNDNIHRRFLSIGIQRRDRYILERLYEFMNKTNGRYIYDYMDKNGFEYSSIQIGGNYLLNSLSKYNIIPNKTWSYVPVNLNDDILMFSFLRGFFDGDGSITNHKYKGLDDKNLLPSAYQISIVGNFDCMLFIKEFLQKYNIKSSMIRDKRKYSHDFYQLIIVENSSIYLFLKHIYKNSVVHLDRKKEIADLFISKFEENVQDRIKYKNAIQDFINCPLYK